MKQDQVNVRYLVEDVGGSQILLIDPSGNFIELFQPKEEQ